MRSRARPPFPVELNFGWGVYDSLPAISEVPVGRVRELGRFVKNHQRNLRDELSARAPAEVGIAVFRLLRNCLNHEVSVVVGDLEVGVAKRNFDLFHTPLILVRGVAPKVTEDSYLGKRFCSRQCFPFAFLVSDLCRADARVEMIETTLALQGEMAVRGLLSLRKSSACPVGSVAA